MEALQKSFVWQFLDGKHDSIIVPDSEIFNVNYCWGCCFFCFVFFRKCKTMF